MLYSVYGLRLEANQPIPGLVPLPAPQTADVQVRLESVPPWLAELGVAEPQLWYVSSYRDERGQPALTIWQLAQGAYFRLAYSDGTEFVVDRAGSRLWASWPPALTVEQIATYLLGPVLGFVLHLRRFTCLHASAVALDGQVVAFVGPPGAGKSTLAAAFAQRGRPVLTDDIVALGECENNFLVQPGYPRLCLWPASVEALYGAAQLPCLTPTLEKRYLDLTQDGYRFQQQPLPLAAIYILGERLTYTAARFVELIPAPLALLKLVANTYTNQLPDKLRRAQTFQLLGRIVARVPVRVLNPAADSTGLAGFCEAILSDIQAMRPLPPSTVPLGSEGRSN